jgi:pimeloyl-ACP methyl ester carboxylesterase
MDGTVAKFFYAFLVVWVPVGCSSVQQEVQRPLTVPNQRGVIFAVDGAGGFHSMSDALMKAVMDANAPLGIEPVHWTHGTGRVLVDQIDYHHVRQEGERLAASLAAVRRTCPASAIYLVAHSAGCAVALAAAEALPPDALDRMVLLAPSVSADYDLRPSLRSCRYTDVFYSTRDLGFLGLAVGLLGTSDRHWQAAAGRIGFQIKGSTPDDPALLARLHQHPWHPCVAWSGNSGGHFGNYQVSFLQAYVLPLLSHPNP